MSSENIRNTKFAAFATLLVEELQYDGLLNSANIDLYVDKRDEINEGIKEAARLLIAQRAYDLMAHAVYSTSFIRSYEDSCKDVDEAPIPDMMKFPEEIV